MDESRDNIAAYVDFESQLAEKFFGGLALRYEDYSDFGSTVDGKALGADRLQREVRAPRHVLDRLPRPGRAAGLLHPALDQPGPAGNLADTLTAANNSAITRALGIPPLQEETSQNYTLGLVARPTPRFRLTVDAYRIDIDDRIIFSDAVTRPGMPRRWAPILNPLGIGQVQFFTNAIDTKTEGLDIVALYDIDLGESLLALEAAVSLNETEVTDIRSLPPRSSRPACCSRPAR